MSDRNALTDLIRRGRMRQVRNLLVDEASFSAALALGGAIVLLLVGTQILNWYWLVLLFAVSLAIGAYRARNKVQTPYQVAQSMDKRLETHDAISTAFYFDSSANRVHANAELVEWQRQSAEDLARTADVRVGVPFFAPRTRYVNLALALAVVALFGIRFGINRNMDLRASLVPIPFDGFLGSSAREVADAKKGQRPFDGDGFRENGAPVDPWQSKPSDLDPAPDAALQTSDTPEVNNPDGGSDPKAQSKATGQEQQTPGDDPMEGEKGESSQQGKDSQGDQKDSPDGGQKSDKQQSGKNANQSPNAGESSSLTDKMRDALANLMAKMKMQPKNGDGKQGGSSQNQQQQAKQGQSQEQNSSSQQQQSDANAQSQGQQSQNAQQQASQGKSDGRSAEKTNTQEGKSGIGKQDGDKTAREAEQLAAMGKISEIIGKRTANVSGEVMVEVASGKQQLRTQYTQRSAAHGEAGGEINRDEIPLAYQQYVQQYFEEIRKSPAAKPSKSDSKARSSGN